MRHSTLCLALLFTAFAGVEARAQSSPSAIQKRVAAEALYQQATESMRAREYHTACPKLEEVIRLQPEGIGAKLTLAECYEGDDRLASAWSLYAAAESAAAKAGQIGRQKKAATRMAALKPRLAHITIEVDPAAQATGLEVTRDDVPVGAAQWAVEMPVDKGPHTVVATAPGKERWERALTLDDGGAASVRISALREVLLPPPAALPPAPVALPPPALPLPVEDSGRARRMVGIVVGSAGLASVIAGAIYGVLTIVKRDQSNDGHCDGNRCDPTGIQLRQDGLGFATKSTALFIAGGIALAGGVTLYLTAPRPTPARPIVAIGPGRIEIRGAW